MQLPQGQRRLRLSPNVRPAPFCCPPATLAAYTACSCGRVSVQKLSAGHCWEAALTTSGLYVAMHVMLSQPSMQPHCQTLQVAVHLIDLCHACSPIVNRRNKDGAEGKPAEAGAKKDDKKATKKPAKKGKRGREPSMGSSMPVRAPLPPFLSAERSLIMGSASVNVQSKAKHLGRAAACLLELVGTTCGPAALTIKVIRSL
jgi:hypothetical protein